MSPPRTGIRVRLYGQMATVSIGLLLAACSGSHEPAHLPAASPSRAQVTHTTNVPALLGTSIDGLRRQLGPLQPLPAGIPPNDFSGISSHAPDSVATFQTGGLTMVASYDARSRQVRELLLLGRHEDSLMSRAGLHTNAANYLILPVFYTGSSNRLLGLRVISIN